MRPGYLSFVALLLAPAYHASAQPGGLDPTFGSGGISLGPAPSIGRGVALDGDGRIVVVGAQSEAGAPEHPLVARLLPDGATDVSFEADTRSIPVHCRYPSPTVLEAVDVASGGRVVAAGTTGCRRGAVVRLLDDGSADPDFGLEGAFHYRPDDFSRSSALLGVDVGDDGTVVAVGREVRRETTGEIRTYLLVLRLTAAGRLDPSFGTGGIVRLRVSDDLLPDSQLSDLVIYPDRRVLATGHVLIAGAYQSVVVRLNADGTPDATFEGGGLVAHDFGDGAADLANALVYGPDGAIYLGGTLVDGTTFAFFGARLRFDGTRDPSFGTAGVAVVRALDGASCVARDVVLDLSGRLSMAGDCVEGSNETWAVARLLPDGGSDSAFGHDGVTRPAAPGSDQNLYGLVRQPDGRLVVAGTVIMPAGPVWAVARLLEGVATEAETRPPGALLAAVAPNPASGSTRVRLSLENSADVTITLFDALGRQAAQDEAGTLPVGVQDRLLDLSSLAPGVYVLRVRAGAQSASRTLVVR